MSVFGRNINATFPVDLVYFLQHGGICALKTNKRGGINRLCFGTTDFMRRKEATDLWEGALLINKRQYVQRFDGQRVKGALVVLVVDVLPNDVFAGVLLLLQLENVPDEELLQLLVGVVDAQLFEAAAVQQTRQHLTKQQQKQPSDVKMVAVNTNLFLLKFSKPKMSSKPIDCWSSSVSSASL